MFLKINSIKEFLCQVIYNFITGEIEMVALPFIFLLSASVEPKIIYISNQTKTWKKYTESNTSLVWGEGEEAFQIFILLQTKKNITNYTEANFIFQVSFSFLNYYTKLVFSLISQFIKCKELYSLIKCKIRRRWLH